MLSYAISRNRHKESCDKKGTQTSFKIKLNFRTRESRQPRDEWHINYLTTLSTGQWRRQQWWQRSTHASLIPLLFDRTQFPVWDGSPPDLIEQGATGCPWDGEDEVQVPGLYLCYLSNGNPNQRFSLRVEWSHFEIKCLNLWKDFFFQMEQEPKSERLESM